jgi:hypothetical protein
MTDFRLCFHLSRDSVLDSWMRIDRLAVTSSSGLDFGNLISELLGRVFFFSPSDSDVFEVKESLEAELRSLAVYAFRFPTAFSRAPALSLDEFDKPTVVAVELVFLWPPNKERTLFIGSSGE